MIEVQHMYHERGIMKHTKIVKKVISKSNGV
jgi:hypothetical protein